MLPIFWIFLGTPRSADAHLAQRPVHVLEEEIEHRLAEVPDLLFFGAKAAEQQRHVQADHVEPSGDCVRNTPLGVEPRLPGLRHNGAIDGVNCLGGRVFAK